MIPKSFIEDLIARVDIVELIQRYVPLKKAGANYAACCPFHNEKSPSFTVSPSKQFYHCFGCGAHGTAISFLMEYAGLGFIDAVKDLAQQMGLEVPDDGAVTLDAPARESQRSLLEVMKVAMHFYRGQLKASPRAIDYLKKRGLSGEIAARFGIGYAPDGWQALQAAFPKYDEPALGEAGMVISNEAGRRYDRFRDRIMFPILDTKGNVIAFGGRILDAGEPKYLNSPETPLFEKGRELYGLPQARVAIRETGTVIVVEGYMDVVALAQFGVGNAVATLGTATTPTHVQKLLRQADHLVFCFDGDKAGRKAARRALEASLPQLADDKLVSFLFLPEEHDPDSYVRANGAQAFQDAAKNATPLGRFLLDTLAEDCDLATAEGRARMVFVARDMIPKISAPVLRLQLIRELAFAAQLSPEEVTTALGLAQPARSNKPYGRSEGRGKFRAPLQPRARVTPLESKLLRALLSRPELGERLPLGLIEHLPDTPERGALVAIVDAGEDGSLLGAPLGAWIEHFRGTPHEASLALAMRSIEEGLIADESVETYLGDALHELELAHVVAEISRLSAQPDQLLQQEGKQRLTELFARRKALSETKTAA
jgi:DNA primase